MANQCQEKRASAGGPLRVKVFRFDPTRDDEPYWQIYTVPRHRATRVLDVLEYIQDELDPELGYRRHICRDLVCDSCFAQIDGRASKTCLYTVRPETDEIVIEPWRDYEHIRDLIVDFDRPKQKA
ncbi:MAG: 2Fe-2S iron-sulfur cluster-binding protein [Anaerolineae bacterium]